MASETGNLYGIRPPKKQPKDLSSSNSLAFASSLSTIISSTAPPRTAGRSRPSKTKSDIFTSHNKNAKKRAAKDLEEDESRGRTGKQDIGDVDDNVLHRSKRKMEEKAKIYARMKRGEYEAKDGEDGLIDFDRKWADNEREGNLDSSDEVESDDGHGEMVDYEDEYGRHRRGTRAEAERIERKKRSQILGAEELDRMSARPAMPEKIIYGDTVQTMAFNPDEEIEKKMEDIARKRDRSLTPPDATHYEADKEIRSKGVGFYSFSKDEGTRMREMEALGREREQTENLRKEREQKKEKRKREIEERRKIIGDKRAKKRADSFLDGLSADMGFVKEKEA
ncbi:hypothetical protein WAI453_002882 [Rhynchosporium graminicola]|uniref:Uncharacterized protein n=1 Tax=Rhynchosporium graminicola TaxID=2792576 RepID=A0A1E1JVH8_9HELO|nr:uncharacterized protein RCO7_02394 [Rhynchosporium commune]